jgi:hypothetical protein
MTREIVHWFGHQRLERRSWWGLKRRSEDKRERKNRPIM